MSEALGTSGFFSSHLRQPPSFNTYLCEKEFAGALANASARAHAHAVRMSLHLHTQVHGPSSAPSQHVLSKAQKQGRLSTKPQPPCHLCVIPLLPALLSNHLGFAVVDASQQVDCGVPLVHVSHGSELPLYSGPKCVLHECAMHLRQVPTRSSHAKQTVAVCSHHIVHIIHILARDAGSDLAVAVEDHRQDLRKPPRSSVAIYLHQGRVVSRQHRLVLKWVKQFEHCLMGLGETSLRTIGKKR